MVLPTDPRKGALRSSSILSPTRRLALGLTAAGVLVAACGGQAPGAGLSGTDVDYALEVLKRAPEHGFAPERFDVERIEQAEGAPRAALIRAALVDYAQAMHGRSIPKSAWPAAWGERPPAYDGEAELAKAIQEKRVRDWLDEQPPRTAVYEELKEAYRTYLRLASDSGWPAVPAGAKFTPGATGPHVQALRARLKAEDPSTPDGDAAAPFDAGLAGAVGRFQASHGLKPTGLVDPDTLRELNVPAITRAAQIRANLERLRWLPRDEPDTRVDVNIAAATMTYLEGGQAKVHMLAASGKPGDETPLVYSAIDTIVLNPPWNVPDGIAQEELYPKQAADPGYFAAHNYVEENGRLIQKPGPDSALGLVKFDFDNPYAVYLHDTPSKAAFSQSQRAVSHGCVRLAQAVPFAKMILSQQNGWSPERVDQVLATRETTHVKLDRKIPVRLMYLTAFPENGHIAFRPDVYGWDAQLLALLDKAPARTVAALAGGRRTS